MSEPAPTARASPGGPWLLFGLVASLLGGLLASYLFVLQASLGDLERDRLSVQAKVVKENLAAQLEAIGRVLESVRGDLPLLRAQPAGMAMANRELRAMARAMPGEPTLMLLDTDGTACASSNAEMVGKHFLDQDSFQAAR